MVVHSSIGDVATVLKGEAIKQIDKRVREGDLPHKGRGPASLRNEQKSEAGRWRHEEIRYAVLPADSWNKYGPQFLALERELFPTELAQQEPELKDTFSDPRAIFITALRGDEVVGFVCGEILRYYVEPGDPEYDPALEGKAIYVESIDVKPSAQGKGIGKKLLQAFLSEARRRGYQYVTGHWRDGPSLNLALKVGGKIRIQEENYNNSGETYSYVVVNLTSN